MSELDYSDYVTIKITKVKFDGEPTHWELDVHYAGEGQYDGQGGTAPTFAGVYDMAYDIIRGGYKNNWDVNEWTEFDANDRNKNG